MTNYGHKCETALRRFGITPFSYIDAGVLEANTMRSREFARKAFVRRINTKRYAVKFAKNDEARERCVQALDHNVETEDGFHRFVDDIEKVADLLDLKITRGM